MTLPENTADGKLCIDLRDQMIAKAVWCKQFKVVKLEDAIALIDTYRAERDKRLLERIEDDIRYNSLPKKDWMDEELLLVSMTDAIGIVKDRLKAELSQSQSQGEAT